MTESRILVRHSGFVNLKRIVDARDGVLCIMEKDRDIPFEIKRVYYITNLDCMASLRGKHAHKKLQQIIFCISGSFILSLDDGVTKQDIYMHHDNQGVILGPELWHTMHDFSNGCVILVAASDYYDESDYIRDYDQFLAYIRQKQQEVRHDTSM